MLVPDTILQNRYSIVRQLGRGGMGAVYEATDQRLHRTVALKETLAETDDLRHAFAREAHLLANLRHPTLPKVIDHFSEGDGLFLVMEFIPGDDLGAMTERGERLFSPAEVLRWADQLLDALEYLHTHQPPVLHRDIKPSNLKLTAQGQIILLDFGLAKGVAGQMPTLTTNNSIFGYTPHYAALEQIRGTGTDPRSDLYSLGATLYHLLTGVKPPDALLRASTVVNDQPDPLRPADEVNRQVPLVVSAALWRAMRLNPGERPATAAEMRRELREGVPSALTTIPIMDEGETIRVEPSVDTGITPRPDVARHQAPPPQRVVIPIADHEGAPTLGLAGGPKWRWILVGGLAICLLIPLSALVYRSNFGARQTDGGASNQPPVNERVKRAGNSNDRDISSGRYAADLAEVAREKLAERSIPYTEGSFINEVEKGDTAAVDLFLAAGMNPNVQDARGWTALLVAAQAGRDHIAQSLLDKGADVNAQSSDGSTALMAAAERAHRDTLNVLLARGADVNLANREGQTALLRAAAKGHSEVARLLLNHGAKVNIRDKEGRSPLAWAEINDHEEVARLLKIAGATKQ